MEPFLFTHELAAQYCEDYEIAHKLTGIYAAYIKETNKIIYIGLVSDSLLKRIKGHVELLINNKHYNKLLQAYHDFVNIKFGLLDDNNGNTDYQSLRELERDYIYQYRDNHLLANVQHNFGGIKAKHALERYKIIKKQIKLNNFILSELDYCDDEEMEKDYITYLREIR